MIQPYFDPTNYFQGGSVFSQYLQGFVKERSAMNKQMMEIALAQTDPSFLQDQIQIMNKNIIELEKAKAKALQGNPGYNKQLMSLVTQQINKESQGKLELAREQIQQGGRAAMALSKANALVTGAVGAASGNDTPQEKLDALRSLFAEGDRIEQEGLAIIIKERADALNIKAEEVIPPNYQKANRIAFTSQYAADRTGFPDARSQTKKALDIVQEFGGGGQMPAESQAALSAQIDKAIKKYEDQRAGYEKQLAKMQEGGADIFAGFSRNYMLDNPFIQMSRSQGKVDALASAIEAAQKEDFRTMPPMPPAPEPDIVKPYTPPQFDSDDEAIAFKPFVASERTESVVFDSDKATDDKGERTGQGFSVKRGILTGTEKLPTQTFAELEIRNPDVASDFYKMVGGVRDRFDVNDSKLMQQKNRTSALNKLKTGKGLNPYERFLTEQSAEDLDAVIDDIYSMPRRDLRRLDKKYPTFYQGKAEVLSQ